MELQVSNQLPALPESVLWLRRALYRHSDSFHRALPPLCDGMKKDTQRCLTAVQIVIDLGTVIAVHCSRGIIQRRQQICFDVSDLRRVLVDAVKDIL